MINWYDIPPYVALEQNLDLSKRLDITAPLNHEGERCPWPWDPQQLTGAAPVQYPCGWCGAMVVAGMLHLDYREDENDG